MALLKPALKNKITVQDLPRLFRVENAGNLEVNYRIRLKLEDGDIEPWTFTVYKGKCGLLPGDDFDADVVLTCNDASLDELLSGVADLTTLYTQRRLAIKGNVDLALKFPRLFGF
jgi:predicted lipid carrier protein YhbT